MTNTNPPQERATAHSQYDSQRKWRPLAQLAVIADEVFKRHEAMRQFGREIQREREIDSEVEAIGTLTWNFLQQHEPDANRRATLWLVGRTCIEEPGEYENPRVGARLFNTWVKAMCANDCKPQP
jgi:hypothetical protein